MWQRRLVALAVLAGVALVAPSASALDREPSIVDIGAPVGVAPAATLTFTGQLARDPVFPGPVGGYPVALIGSCRGG